VGALDVYKAHIVKPSDLNKPNFIALYGCAGGGKSWLAASISDAPGYNRVLIIDTENSTQGTVANFDDAKIDIIPVSTHGGFEAVWQAVLEEDAAGTLEYDAVVIDTLDVAQDRALAFFESEMEATGKADGFAKWGRVKEWTEAVGRKAQEMTALTIVVTHSKREKTENGPFSDMLNLAGSAKDTFPGIPDIVAFVEREGDTTTVHVGSSKNRSTKNRFNLESTIENPTMTTLLAAISEHGSEKSTPKAAPKAAPKKEEK